MRCIFSLCPMYKLQINRHSLKLTPIFLSNSSSLVQSTRSKAFCQSMKQRHISYLTSSTLSDIILINPIASLVPLPFRNPNWSSSITSSILLSNLLLPSVGNQTNCSVVTAFLCLFFLG